MRLKTVFAGTPDFSVPSLHALLGHDAIDLVAAYTQPDRGSGRGRKSTASPVKQVAIENGIPIYQPNRFAETEIETFRSHKADLFIVAAFGMLLPQNVLDLATHCYNVHASLLPRWRGAAPIQRAIMAGDKETGISIMRVVLQLDAGPVILQKRCAISDEETGGTLHDKLSVLGAACLHDAIELLVQDRIQESPQDESLVTYAKKIGPQDRVVDWSLAASDLSRQIRALNPAPGIATKLNGIDVKLAQAVPLQSDSDTQPGTIVEASAAGIDVATGDQVLRISMLQPNGKRRMSAAEFYNGFRRVFA